MSIHVTSTGYWGVPGRAPRNPKVHAICGARFDPAAEYQWCGNGLHRNMIDCQSCLRVLDREAMRKADAEESARIEEGCKRVRARVDCIIRTARSIIDDLEREMKPARKHHGKR